MNMNMNMNSIRIQQDDFSIAAEIDAVRATSKRIGAIVNFLGCARDFSQDRTVSAIHFEQYPAMAMPALQDLHSEALQRFDIIAVRIVHRVTTVHAGEQIILIVVAAEHRAPAFAACNWLIDTLKQRVPIWKKEI